ncbi:MAG: GntR family transcriptional regulator [Ilumatobacteraceae bacterium]
MMADFGIGALQIDRSGHEPLWAQLEHELRRRLDLGHFSERFPTDRELMEVYGVSRHTARHAVQGLGNDGIVRRSRGIGTTVDDGRLEQSLGSLYSLFRVVEDAGHEQSSTVLALREDTDDVAAQQLGLPAGSMMIHLDRLRLAAGEVLALDRVRLDADVARCLLDVDFTHTALYDELEASGIGRPTSGIETITPATVHGADADLLDVAHGSPVFCVVRTGCVAGRPIEHRTTLLRGDRASFVADWRAGRRSDVRAEFTL